MCHTNMQTNQNLVVVQPAITSSAPHPPLLCDAPGPVLNHVKIPSDHGKWLSCARTEDCDHILHCIVIDI
jgi:hypothetical protein